MDWFDNIRNDEEKSAKLQKMVDANAKKFFSKGFPPQEKWEPDMAGRLKEITVPVLVMVGEKDSPDNKKVAEIIRQNIHNTEFMLVPDSGHMTCIENPDFVNKQILKFLQKY